MILSVKLAKIEQFHCFWDVHSLSWQQVKVGQTTENHEQISHKIWNYEKGMKKIRKCAKNYFIGQNVRRGEKLRHIFWCSFIYEFENTSLKCATHALLEKCAYFPRVFFARCTAHSLQIAKVPILRPCCLNDTIRTFISPPLLLTSVNWLKGDNIPTAAAAAAEEVPAASKSGNSAS